MVIDFHTHIFPEYIAESAIYKLSLASNTIAFTDGTEKGLLASMEKAGINLSVVLPVATNPEKVWKINEISASQNENFSMPKEGERRILHFGCIHPFCEDVEKEMRHVAALGLRGVKIHPIYQGACIHDDRFVRILDLAGELDLVVVTHAGDDMGFPGEIRCSPEMIREALDRAGYVKLVLAHMGGWQKWDAVREYLADTTAYIDTSLSLGELAKLDISRDHPHNIRLMDGEEFVSTVRRFGSDRVLFGTDSPWSGQTYSLEFVKAMPFTEREKKNIFENNARAILKLC